MVVASHWPEMGRFVASPAQLILSTDGDRHWSQHLGLWSKAGLLELDLNAAEEAEDTHSRHLRT